MNMAIMGNGWLTFSHCLLAAAGRCVFHDRDTEPPTEMRPCRIR